MKNYDLSIRIQDVQKVQKRPHTTFLSCGTAEPWTLSMLGKYCTMELHAPPLSLFSKVYC